MSRILFALALLAIAALPVPASAEKSIFPPGTTPTYRGQQTGQQALRAPAPQQQGENRMIACSMEAKACPDGSYVSRTGPNCEFAACPGGTSGGAVPAPMPVPQPEEPQGIPDLPLVGIPSSAVSVEFLTQHRSALNGKILTVKGYVTDFCAPGAECGDPHVSLADEADGSGYSMSVSMSSSDLTTYTVGQSVEIYGEASSDGDMVSLHKE